MERGLKNKRVVLFAVVAVLVLLVLYAFVVHPAVNGYVVKLQNQSMIQGVNQGVIYTLDTILSQVQQKGYVQIPAGNNQTLTLINPQLCDQYLASLNSSNSSK